MIENKLKRSKVTTAILSLGLSAGLALSPVLTSAQNRYTHDSGKGVVKSGTGLCWQSPGGTAELREECGDVIPQPEVAMPVDSDGDGVPDSRDRCPNTPRGVSVDSNGCPLDSDGDGVPDYLDRCPNTPAGAKVDSEGCEIIESVTINLDVDEFDFDSAMLKPQMKDALEDIAMKISESAGNEMLKIVGHTDSVGPEDYNMKLSVRRAQSAADYLIEQGVASDRISIDGMGEMSPIADNGTREGRARNRRVEIQTN